MTRDAMCTEGQGLLRHAQSHEIPAAEDLFTAESLEAQLQIFDEPKLSLLAAGDIMLAGRAKRPIAEYGCDYPFEAVLPLLRRSSIVLGNLEGPLATAPKLDRAYSYRVNPKLASALADAGINVVTIANNHLLDCGRDGVLETLSALQTNGIAKLGAGVNKKAAHAPFVTKAGPYNVGLLGYYWNSRTAATDSAPGSAMDTREELEADIKLLRSQADRIVVTFHWGIPYEREPSLEDRAKARLAVDCGADVVIGHHPHIVQPFEIYDGRPIFYSVGNFAFGSGNSRAEGLLIGLTFEETETKVFVYPLYVKNRDSRVNYQPKVLRGEGAIRVLQMLAEISDESGTLLGIADGRGSLVLPRTEHPRERSVPGDA